MNIVLFIAVAMAVVATTASLEHRRVDQIEGNKLRELNPEDERDKRHLAGTISSIHAASIIGKTTDLRHHTYHKTRSVSQKRYGLRGSRPLLGLGTGLSHTTNRQILGAGIRGPLGAASIYSSKYSRAHGSLHGIK